ncbi:MAG: PadR family transcriptional regulator [Bacteroidota bacterium]
MQWSNSKLYPILHKMACDGLIDVYREPSESGPDRKYYCLTAQAQRALDAMKDEWWSMNAIFVSLWAPAAG